MCAFVAHHYCARLVGEILVTLQGDATGDGVNTIICVDRNDNLALLSLALIGSQFVFRTPVELRLGHHMITSSLVENRICMDIAYLLHETFDLSHLVWLGWLKLRWYCVRLS